MIMIDLCEHFKNQNVEGIERHELLKALDGESDVFQPDGDRILLHKPSGKRIVLDCAMEYFKPEKSYYRFNKNSRCSFVQRALGVDSSECNECFRQCLQQELSIKPKKVVMAKDYFTK